MSREFGNSQSLCVTGNSGPARAREHVKYYVLVLHWWAGYPPRWFSRYWRVPCLSSCEHTALWFSLVNCCVCKWPVGANGTSVCEILENGQNCTPFLGMDATRPWDSADLKGFVSPMANLSLKVGYTWTSTGVFLEFPRDWSKSPFPKDGLPKYCSRRSEVIQTSFETSMGA